MVNCSKRNNKLKGGNPYIGREISTLTDQTMSVNSIAFHPTAPILATTSGGNTAKLWRLSADNSSATCVDTLKGHFNIVLCVAFHPSEPLLATGSADCFTKLWRLSADNSSATYEATLDGDSSPVQSLAFHPTAPLLATGGWDNIVKLWRLSLDNSSLSYVALLRGHSKMVTSVSFHPSGNFLATGSKDNTVKFWRFSSDGSNPICIDTLTGHTDWVLSVAFHPSGQFLATGSDDNTVKLWRLRPDGSNSRCIETLTGHTSPVTSVAFHPSGNLLATGSNGNTLKLWDCTKINILLRREALTRASLSAKVIKDFTTGNQLRLGSEPQIQFSNAAQVILRNPPDTRRNRAKSGKITSEKYKGLPREPISSTPSDDFTQCDSCRANDAEAAAWAAVDPEYRLIFNKMSKSRCADCPGEATEADTDKMPGGRRSRKKLKKRLSRKLMIR